MAEGKIDLYIDQGLSLWDYAAGWCILNECGGFLDTIVKNGKEVIITGGNESLVRAAKHLITAPTSADD